MPVDTGHQLRLDVEALEAYVFANDRARAIKSAGVAGSADALFLQGMQALHSAGLPDGFLDRVAAAGTSPAAVNELELRALLAAASGPDARPAIDQLVRKLKALGVCPPLDDVPPLSLSAAHAPSDVRAAPSALEDAAYGEPAFWALLPGRDELEEGASAPEMAPISMRQLRERYDSNYVDRHLGFVRCMEPRAVMHVWNACGQGSRLSGHPTLVRMALLEPRFHLPVAALEGAAPVLEGALGAFAQSELGGPLAMNSLSMDQVRALGGKLGWSRALIQAAAERLAGQCYASTAARMAPGESVAFLDAYEALLRGIPAADESMLTEIVCRRFAALSADPGVSAACLEGACLAVLERCPLRLSRSNERVPDGWPQIGSGDNTWPRGFVDLLFRLLLRDDCQPGAFLAADGPAAKRIDEALRAYLLALAMLLRGTADDEWATKYAAARSALLEERLPLGHRSLYLIDSAASLSSGWPWVAAPPIEELAARSEVAFGPGNLAYQPLDGDLSLQVQVKNVAALDVKVYEIELVKFYRATRREVDHAIALEGLGPSQSFTLDVAAPPFQLRTISVAVPSAAGRRGVFVVDVSGGDLTCRAVVRKGALAFTQRATAGGHALTVVYEDGSRVDAAVAYVGGKRYEARGSSREVYVPYRSPGAPATCKLVLSDERGLARLVDFAVKEESYELRGELHVERETLVSQNRAPILVRTALLLHGHQAPLQLLQDVKLRVETTDASGVTAAAVVDAFKLAEPPELAQHLLTVPERCRSLRVTLSARVRLSALGANGMVRYQDVSLERSIELNGFEDTGGIGDLRLVMRPDRRYALHAVGRCGEALPGRPVDVQLRHWAWTVQKRFELATNEHGVCDLGALGGIAHIRAKLGGNDSSNWRSWPLQSAQAALPDEVHTVGGEEISFPYESPTWGTDAAQEGLCLTRVVPLFSGGASVRPGPNDRPSGWLTLSTLPPSHATLQGRALRVTGLDPGRYRLHVPSQGREVLITVLAPPRPSGGSGFAGHLFAEHSLWQLNRPRALQVTVVSASQASGIEVQVECGGELLEGVRVTVMLTRYVPEGRDRRLGAPDDLVHAEGRPTTTPCRPPTSDYLSGVRMKGEARYVLERRATVARAPPRPGCLLAKPSLLVDRREVRDIAAKALPLSGPVDAAAEALEGRPGGRLVCTSHGALQQGAKMYCMKAARRPRAFGDAPCGSDDDYGEFAAPAPCLDAVPPACVIVDLECGGDGRVRVPPSALPPAFGGHTLVRVVASSSTLGAAFDEAPIAGGPPPHALPVRDVRKSAAPVAQDALYTRSQRSVRCRAGDVVTVADITNAKVAVVDDLQRTYDLFAALLDAPALCGAPHPSGRRHAELWREFAFLPGWRALGAAAKAELLSRHACHELFFFVKAADPLCFEELVRPYLAMRLPAERDFMTLYLLDDVAALEGVARDPARLARLNGVESVLLASALRRSEALAVLALKARGLLAADEPHIPTLTATQQAQLRFAAALQCGGGGGLDAAMVASAIEDAHEYAMLAGAPAPPPPMAFGAASSLFGAAHPSAPMAAISSQMAGNADQVQGALVDSDSDDDASALNLAGGGGGGHEDDLRAREELENERSAEGQPTQTKEWVEAAYFQASAVGTETRELAPLSPFWADYADWCALPAAERPAFLSKLLHEAPTTFTGAALALAVLAPAFERAGASTAAGDAPEAPAKAGHDYKYSGMSAAITAASPAVVFLQEIRALSPSEMEAARRNVVRVSGMQTLFDPADRFDFDPVTGQSTQRQVALPLVAGKAYGHHVVLTNVSCNELRADVLLPCPTGAVPLDGKAFVEVQQHTLPPFSCLELTQTFYFPEAGSFAVPATTLVRSGELVGWLEPALKRVDVAAEALQREGGGAGRLRGVRWLLSGGASDEEVLDAVASCRYRLAPEQLAWRCRRSATFYTRLVDLLRRRLEPCAAVSAYGLLHGDAAGVGEWLALSACLAAYLPAPLRSDLLTLDEESGELRQLEYWPLVNPRAHAIAGKRPSVCGDLEQQWARLLRYWARKAALSAQDKVQAAYYLASMDRLDEAERLLEEADAAEVQDAGACVMQRDYLRAYLTLASSAGDVAAVQRLVERHSACRHAAWVPRWLDLQRFVLEVEQAQQLNVAASASAAARPAGAPPTGKFLTVDDSELATNGRLAVAVNPEAGRDVTLALHRVDVELLFSADPFGATLKDGAAASHVRPHSAASVTLPDDGHAVLDLERLLPGAGDGSVVIEVSCGELQKTVSCFARGTTVRFEQERGVLTASSKGALGDARGGAPLVAAYVKVFARSQSRQVRFWKDGYTDRLGRFDYAAMSRMPGSFDVASFAVLVTPGQGGVALEVVPPPSWLV